jgi:hypothetical protein
MAMNEQSATSVKKPPRRGLAKKTIALIEAMRAIIEVAQPITGRGVGYELFVKKLIASMKTGDMQRVYDALKQARERGTIPWHWIVDESRHLEKSASWDDPEEFAQSLINSYRREYWTQQPVRVEVWSEKGTVRGLLRPVLDEFGVGFRVVHGFASATVVHDVAEDNDGRKMSAIGIRADYACPSMICPSG